MLFVKDFYLWTCFIKCTLFDEKCLSAYINSTVLDCIDTTSIKLFLYDGVRLSFLSATVQYMAILVIIFTAIFGSRLNVTNDHIMCCKSRE